MKSLTPYKNWPGFLPGLENEIMNWQKKNLMIFVSPKMNGGEIIKHMDD